MKTEIAKSLDIADTKVQYDTYCKRVLSNKNILSWILKFAVNEYKDEPVKDINILIIGEPLIGEVSAEPGMTSDMNIRGSNTEDSVPNEGTIRFDILFNAMLPGSDNTASVIIDIEAQKDPNPGYNIITRGLFYAGRLLSSQYGQTFTARNYDAMKKVFSIWICQQKPSRSFGNAISRYKIAKEDVLGVTPGEVSAYDKLEVIMINLEPADKSGNELTSLLNVLFNNNDVERKKRILEEHYNIPMDDGFGKELDLMCNFSDYIFDKGMAEGLEKGIKEGIENGIKKGRESGKREIIYNMLRENMPDAQIMQICKITREELDKYKEELLVTA